jgi:predicted dehydrogenase
MRRPRKRPASLVVGLGKRGLLHVHSLVQHADPALLPVAVFDRQDVRRALVRGLDNIVVFDTYQQLANYTFDGIVIVATPPAFHFEYVSQFVGRSRLLLVEKPCVKVHAHLRELINLSDNSTTRVFVGYSERVNPLTLPARNRIKELVAQGTVVRLNIVRSRPFPNETWRKLGTELAVHDLDFVLNDLFPAESLMFEDSHMPNRLTIRSYVVRAGILVHIISEWANDGGRTEMSAHLKDGSIEQVTVPLPSQADRLSALEAQLRRILDQSEGSIDLIRERRVLGALYEGRC